MSVLSNKYNIPEETVSKMIKDGVISCSWSTYDEVTAMRKNGKSVDEIASTFGVSRRHIYNILGKVK